MDNNWYAPQKGVLGRTVGEAVNSLLIGLIAKMHPTQQKQNILLMYQAGLLKPIEVELLFARFNLRGA